MMVHLSLNSRQSLGRMALQLVEVPVLVVVLILMVLVAVMLQLLVVHLNLVLLLPLVLDHAPNTLQHRCTESH